MRQPRVEVEFERVVALRQIGVVRVDLDDGAIHRGVDRVVHRDRRSVDRAEDRHRAIARVVHGAVGKCARPGDVVPLPDVLGLIVEPLERERHAAEHFVSATDVELVDVRAFEVRIRIRQRDHAEAGRHLREIDFASRRQVDASRCSLCDVVPVEIRPRCQRRSDRRRVVERSQRRGGGLLEPVEADAQRRPAVAEHVQHGSRSR